MDPQVINWLKTIALWEPMQMAAAFVWGAADPMPWMIAKRTFLLLPFGAIAIGYWTTLFCLPTILVRAHRKPFVGSMVITWWDLARSVFTFWGGTFRFGAHLATAGLSAAQMLAMGTWSVIQDMVFLPLRMMKNLGQNVATPGTPWIAVSLTVAWSVFEAMIFTFVTTPLVIDTLSNLTGTALSESFIRIPLFGFMLFIALGSYSVLSTWTQALKSRNIASILKIGAIESVALFVEVVFLYREFVDALVPWFAQHSTGKFELGIVGTLAIAGLTWFGIRSLSWFLFAAAGTPTIMAILQGTGISSRTRPEGVKMTKGALEASQTFLEQLKRQGEWAQKQGDALLGAFVIPPAQIVAATANFFSLLVNNRHLFDLPFRNMGDLKDAKTLMQNWNDDSENRKRAA